MSEQPRSLMRKAIPRLGVLLLFALSEFFSVLYQHSFEPGRMVTRWTDDLHMISVLLVLAGLVTPIGLMISEGRPNIVDPLLVILGVLIFLNSSMP